MNKYDLITSINTSSAQNSGGMPVVVLMGIITNDVSQWHLTTEAFIFWETVCSILAPSPLDYHGNRMQHTLTILHLFILFYIHVSHLSMIWACEHAVFPNILLPWFPHLKGKAGAASGFPRRGVAVLPWPICVCRSWRRTSAQGWAEIFAA